jgi:hypothetical protein
MDPGDPPARWAPAALSVPLLRFARLALAVPLAPLLLLLRPVLLLRSILLPLLLQPVLLPLSHQPVPSILLGRSLLADPAAPPARPKRFPAPARGW